MTVAHATRAVPGPRLRAAGSRATSWLLLAACSLTVLVVGCATGRQRSPGPGTVERGVASWYGTPFHGRRTANGEVYDMYRLTAAHKKLAFGTVVEVTNLANGQRVEVRINDRGPHVKRRIIDLSRSAADAIGMVSTGTASVEVRILRAPPAPRYTVQVGAFAEAERARALAEELRERYPEIAVTSDGVWHRVQVGSYGRRGDAEAVRRELRARGLIALVVPAPAVG